MRRSPRTLTVAFAVALLVLALGQGCASRKKVSSTTPEPTPPPPPTETTTPPTETTPPPPPPSSTETQAQFQDAFFDYDDASLRDDAKSALENDAKILERSASMKVVMEGHCDERGSVEYNLALGEKRARAAKQFLTTYGIDASRITTISYGKERPFDPGHSEESWAQNRRAHLVQK